MIDFSLWDEIKVVGNPWHGVMNAAGQLTLDTGPVKAGVRPLAYGAEIDTARPHVLVRFADQPAPPAATLAETEAGMIWKNDAILAGPQRQYSPFSNVSIGVNTWLFRTVDLTVWVLEAVHLNSTTLRIKGSRLNVKNDLKLTLADIAHTADNNFSQVWPAPDGAHAVVPFGSVIRAIEITVSAGTATIPPVVVGVVEADRQRNVVDTVSLSSNEMWIGARYLATGVRVDFWEGGSREYSGPTTTYKRWLWVGAVRYDLMTNSDTIVVSGTPTWMIIFDGHEENGTSFEAIHPMFAISVDPAIGVMVRYSPQNQSLSRRILISPANHVVKDSTTFGADGSPYVTDPRTGLLRAGNWVW